MVKAKCDNQYVSYVLEDNTKFYTTGYRVLKKQKDKGFIPCSKIHYNGYIKLLYPITEYDSVSVAVDNWSKKEVFEWMLRFLDVLIEVRDSGFLRMEDVDMDLSHIFVNESAGTVHLIVVPLTVDMSINAHWEQTLSNTLVSLIEISRMRNYEHAYGLKQIIRNNCNDLNELCEKLKIFAQDSEIEWSVNNITPNKTKKEEEIPKGELHLLMKYLDGSIDIAVTKESFIIGKNPKMSDGVLAVSPTISRQHCKITRENGKYYIEDMDSLNHTFVNGKMLEKDEKVWIRENTKICLADFEFDVEFRR